MSTVFAALKKISITELFDGRLDTFGVLEFIEEDGQKENRRVLTDGDDNYLVVVIDENDNVDYFVRYAGCNAPWLILDAIEAAFDTRIVSENEPEYWGFETEEERDAAILAGESSN
jgi:hypothetical protein